MKYARDSEGFVIIDFLEPAPHKKGPPVGFERKKTGKSSWLDTGNLPQSLATEVIFEEIWNIHPETRHEILMYGKKTPVPRYQQAYLRDYTFSGSTSKILPLPEVLKPYMDYANNLGYPGKFNGFLINWYESGNNYIGSHADNESQIVPESPIITITLSLPGEQRIFRIRDDKKQIKEDIKTPNGIVLVMGGSFQKEFKHEIVKTAKPVGSRISITIRQFK